MKGCLVLVAVILSLLSVVYSLSTPNPSISYLCDALSSKWGCSADQYFEGQRGYCKEKGQLMSWAVRPNKTNCFVLSAGNESKPDTTYTPDEITRINIRVVCRTQRFRGLMMYAVDSQENKTGDWEISGGDEKKFIKPWPSNSTCAKVLMHSTAELKPYISNAFFKGPPKGTGTITFRVLIKVGDANRGEFYWPLTDLVLNETVPEVDTKTFWKLGDVGQSCSEACGAEKGYSCDEAAFKSQPSFKKEVPKHNVCVLPLMSGCGNDAGLYDAYNQYCYYAEPNCAKNNRSAIKPMCDVKSSKNQRFCACTLSQYVPATPGTDMESSSANNLRGVSALLCLSMFFFSPRIVTIFLIFFGVTSAHNWVNTQSRASGASLYQPFVPALTDLPHVQVGPGQMFQVEFQTAHFLSTYFSVVHSKYQDKIALISDDLLNDYIKNAPASGVLDHTNGIHQKLHRKDNTNMTIKHDSEAKTYKRIVPKGDPLFISRHPYLEGDCGTVRVPNDTNTYLFEYKDEDKAKDRVVSYKSAKYPWLEAVFLYEHIDFQADYPDTTNIFIPGFAGFGRYIVHYYWQAYRDAIDVDYVNHQVDNIYGTPSDAVRWKRVDHCAFRGYTFSYSMSEILTNQSLDHCLKICGRDRSCEGVNVVPLVAPPSVYRFDAEPQWVYPNIYGSDILVNWKAVGLYPPQLQAVTDRAAPDRFICTSVNGLTQTDTTDIYTLSKDPSDAVFYSTCYHPYRGNMFPGYPTDKSLAFEPSSNWKFESRCLDCDAQAYNTHAGVTPKWTMTTDTCVNCDKEPRTPKPVIPSPQSSVVEKGARCGGTGNCSTAGSCAIRLVVPGRTTYDPVTVEECNVMTATTSNCSNTFYSDNNLCYCFAKMDCCLNCSRRTDAAFTVYEVKAAAADPQCASGVKSADGKACCSASCGVGKCNSTSTDTKEVGFCCPTCITRPCSKYAPPCTL